MWYVADSSHDKTTFGLILSLQGMESRPGACMWLHDRYEAERVYTPHRLGTSSLYSLERSFSPFFFFLSLFFLVSLVSLEQAASTWTSYPPLPSLHRILASGSPPHIIDRLLLLLGSGTHWNERPPGTLARRGGRRGETALERPRHATPRRGPPPCGT